MSGFDAVIRRAREQDVLLSVLLELTHDCNLDCCICYTSRLPSGPPLRLEEHLELLTELAGLQVLFLTLSGGEPLLHPDLLTIGARARELGFVTRIKSNGHALGPELARAIGDRVDPYAVEVSLHGADAATHDRQTRVPGSFERLLANLRSAADAGLRLEVRTVLTAWNEAEIEGVLALARSLGATARFDPQIAPTDDGDRSPLALRASEAAVQRLLELGGAVVGDDDPSETRGRPGRLCGAGTTSLAVDPFGTVFPCVQWRRPLGSLHDQTIGEIWTTSPALAEIRRLNEQAAEEVPEAHAASPFGFCPGLAAALTGSPIGRYRYASEEDSSDD
jgi:MoaA/NifB/PqqE/SkfB family radical SAM enzyme